MTHNEARLMRFALRYSANGEWHSYGADATRTLQRLAGHGLLELSSISKQFRLARPVDMTVANLPASETA
jgi:hypothetical protein